MKPIKVEFQAFGPYAGYEVVDLEAVSSKGLFLICGKTGIGKTMILDAITFALYGKSSGHGRDDFEAMRCTNADFNTDTFVRFEFENHGKYYLFERRLIRKRKNLSQSYNVALKDDDGVFQPLMENAKDKAVSEKAVEIIGLEYEQFIQVIVLPQGQFEKLLTSGSDEKEKILTSIFGEERWQRIADIIYEKAELRKNDLKATKEKIEISLAEEKCDSITGLKEMIEKMSSELHALEKEYESADYDSIIKEKQGLLSIAKRFGDLKKAEDHLTELEGKSDERMSHEKKLADARRGEKMRGLLEAEKSKENALQKRRTEEESVKKEAAIKSRAAEDAAESLRLHLTKEKDILGFKEKKILFEGKRHDYDGLDEAEKELSLKKAAVSDALKAENEAKKKSYGSAEVVLRLNSEYSALDCEHNDLLNSYLAGITGELAATLKDGCPCPVCGSTEHPHKADLKENSITRAMVESKKKERDQKYSELQKSIDEQNAAKKLLEEKHALFEKANMEAASLEAKLESRKKNLVDGIDSAKKLDAEIRKLQETIEDHEKQKGILEEAEKKAKNDLASANAGVVSAVKESSKSGTEYDEAVKAVEKGLSENGFTSREEAESLMLSEDGMSELSSLIASYDANLKSAKSDLDSLREELKGKDAPDEEECEKAITSANNAKGEFREKRALLSKEIERLQNKLSVLMTMGSGIEENIREAEEDFIFAKKLRGDSGTGLQRYVLGIMFSSVVNAANKMLELVHGGRYRLFRSDEKAQGSNKRGLELKVFDKHSEDHEGRFVKSLSGGEKFLVSLALSIGMSTIAQKSGIRIEALFIDEGFGSLDEDSIDDAMNVLSSIKEANGMVGIISHVKILQDQIPVKLCVEEDSRGSHIVESVG